MHVRNFTRALDRLQRARARLGDQTSPVNRIPAPAGMRSRTYEGLIAKVERIEAYLRREILALKPRSGNNRGRPRKLRPNMHNSEAYTTETDTTGE